MGKILVTGASGFIGRALCSGLREKGIPLRRVFRMPPGDYDSGEAGSDWIAVGDINAHTDWAGALEGIETVIHLAARVHVMEERVDDSLAEYRMVNTSGTERLARAAVKAGVKRFLYISSVKVNGEATEDSPFTEESPAAPRDPYAVSKWEAECVLRAIAAESGMEVVIIRLPLVYGPEVGGNFLRLLNWVYKGMPLPFGSIRNKRSLLYLGNLIDFLTVCADHPQAPGNTFLISDGDDLSTSELIKRLAGSLDRPARVVPFSASLLRLGAKAVKREPDVRRLLGSLQVDSGKAMRILEWSPPLSVDEGIGHTASWFLSYVGEKAR